MPHDKITAKIRELLPDTQKLEFGCEVVYDRRTCKYLTHVEGFCDVMLPPKYDKGILQVTNPRLKILGRPLQLHDILRAIGKVRAGFDWAVTVDGRIIQNQGGVTSIFIASDYRWNLSTDWNGQSDEVKEFVGKIIGVTK